MKKRGGRKSYPIFWDQLDKMGRAATNQEGTGSWELDQSSTIFEIQRESKANGLTQVNSNGQKYLR